MKNTAVLMIILLITAIACPLAAEENEEPVVSTLFFETDIREALNEVMLQTGVNIIYDDTVRGTVTLDLDEVPLSRALRMMLIAGGFTYQEIDGFYLVGMPDPRSPAFKELTESETIRLNYITASEATDLLPRFYRDFLQTSAQRDNLMTVSAPPAVIAELKDHLAQIDTAEEQVIIHVIVTEVSTDVLRERGTGLMEVFTDGGDAGLSFFDYLSGDEDQHFLGYDGGLALATAGSHARLLTELRALERKEKAEIRANPRIQVSNRETAELFVGEEQVLILAPEDAPARLERVDVGVTLEVTPQVLNERELRIAIAPNISHFTDERRDELVVRRSEMATTIRARSGETLTLAGMTLDEIVEFESAVPLLGDIPLLRWLFRRETEKEAERELLIFLTPEIKEEG